MSIVVPTLFVGRRDAMKVLQWDVAGQTDDGQSFSMLAQSNPFWPAGEGGEAVFRALYVPIITDQGDFAFTVTPIVEGVRLDATVITVPAVTARLAERYEIPVSVGYSTGGVERVRSYARGAWIMAEIAGTITKHVIFGAIAVEFAVVRETRKGGVA